MPEFYYASIEIIIFAKLLLIIILIRIALFINSNFYNYRNDFLNYCYNHKKPFFRSEKKHHERELGVFNSYYKPKMIKIKKISGTVLIVLFACIFGTAFDFAFLIFKKDIIITLFSKFNIDFINNIISNSKTVFILFIVYYAVIAVYGIIRIIIIFNTDYHNKLHEHQ
ncbi:hypothetical protein [Brachyspira hyodysenteriae]|uniref:hypothetical protein n=1 Tax=Brachyspira hyodysenteriae TaxID=159 RepID=UPI00063DD64E|nr:hypothetical protein [Brachyspira hyodysenteriae]KLI60738.1 hypothetical protein SZ44_04360 [Brachyspira hyodysenteriae]